MARFDVLFSESHTATNHLNNTATTTGSVGSTVKLEAGGANFTVTTPTLAFVEGQIVELKSGSTIAYCRIARVQTVSTTSTLTLIPLQSAIDSAGAIDFLFPVGSSITSSAVTPARAATLVVDLTEAPFSSSKYLIVASGNFQGAASSVAGACLRTSGLVGDPYSGSGVATSGNAIGQTSVTWGTNAAELAPFMAATEVTLSGGQRYEFAVEFWSGTANTTATFDECAIMAVRCDTIYSNTTGQVADTTTTSTTFVDKYALTSNLTAGNYLVVATWALKVANTANPALAKLLTGVSGLADNLTRLTLRSATDYVSCGSMFVIENMPATNAIKLQLATETAGTATMRNAYIAAIPLPRGFDACRVGRPADNTTAATTATNTDVTVGALTSATLPHAGRAIQVVSSDVGTSTLGARTRWRATTSAGTNTLLAHGMVWQSSGSVNDRHSTFFLYRQSLSSGSNSIALLGRSPNTALTTLTARSTAFSWLLERADLAILPNTPTSIVVDLENGGLLLKTWSASGSAYRKHLPVATGISRVLVNGVEYTKAASVAALASQRWYWDATAQDVYVQLPSGTPADADKQVVVIPQLLISRDHEDLVSDDDGVTYLPYDARIDTVPGMTQELVSNDGRFETSTSLGSLTLATADGMLDDPLVQHYYDGIRARVRRGWSSLSSRLGDFEVVADALVGMPDTDFQTVTFKLFDRGLNIAKPVATSQITSAWSGDATSETETNKVPLPVIYGTVKRVKAYRVERKYGNLDTNKFQLAGHALSSIVAVYLDETTPTKVSTSNYTATSTYRNVGQVLIKNAAFADPTKPQDTVFVDVVGRTTNTADGDTTALTTSGSIARDLLTTYGGLAGTDLIEPSFRLLDRAWRKQLTVSPYGFVPKAPSIGFYVEGDEDVWSALLRLCGDVGAYPYVSRTGRVGVGVVDMDAPTLLDNGGFEVGDSSTWVRSWSVASGATMKVSTSRKYEGSSSLEASNGASPTTTARVEQSVVLPTPGSYVFSCLASLIGGETASFRLACYLPDGTEALSEPFTVSSLRWTRCTFAFDTAVGSAGSARVRLYPAYGSTTATTIAVDNAELLPVAFVGDDGNTLAASLEFREDTFYEAAVSYDVNLQDQDNASRLVLTDGEARGLATGVTDAKYAAQSSKRLDLGTPLVKDTASAAGIGASLLAWFGRTRHVLSLDAFSLSRVPNVGERVYLKNIVQLVKNDAGEVIQRRHVPELADAYPFWLITEVAYEGDNAQVVSLKLERQQDPVVDRVEMSPEAIPMGAIGLAVSSSSIADFSDFSDMNGYYVGAWPTPDVSREYGQATHQHTLTHTHSIPAHGHSATAQTLSIGSTGPYGPTIYDSWNVGLTTYPNPDSPSYSPVYRFLAAPLTHTHTLSTTSQPTGSSGGVSSEPTVSLTSRVGSNEAPHARVRFVQRTNSTASTIDSNMVVGYESATIPAGWTRVTYLDGCFVRGATANGVVNTTTSASFTPSESGSTLSVTAATNISVGKLLQVGSGGTRCRVLVQAISGTALTVIPVWESGDSSGSYASGTTVSGASETVGSTAFVPDAHDHALVIPSHAHTGGGHTHVSFGYSNAFDITDAQPVSSPISVTSSHTDSYPSVIGMHQHFCSPTAQADTTLSGSAGGTISGASLANPSSYSVVWIKPSTTGLTVLPTGALMFWPISSDPPAGWVIVKEAHRLLIRGADSGSGSSVSTSNHTHSMTPASHTLNHQHGGSGTTFSSDGYGERANPQWNNGAPTQSASAGSNFSRGARLGHSHLVTHTIAATDPTLSAAATQPVGSVSGTQAMPPHKRLVLIRKV